ncbi:ASCH domain-containing protein [Aeromicrobium sp. Leaf350]|uniref:ASCH domain-containing protein n=1 Tax=Aeromicrobium sp. Leaf350 TaxID=2876565 RepID=UPI001E2D723F|nr:ASCH domain-containing protein [Aeromicrobium sp. Leaf350]
MEPLAPTDDAAVETFWRATGGTGPAPEAWAFGDHADLADELLALVLDGTKTATASSLWDVEADGDPVPRVGDLSILLDGAGAPRALIRTTQVRIVPFIDVDAEHARLEGEGDLTLQHWRDGHESFFRRTAVDPRGFDPAMPVVCERFELVSPTAP